MMRSLFSGVAGLKNHQTRMDVVGNNIANVNTVGYKAGRTTFQDMLSQSVKGAASPTGTTGGVNPLQIGLGMGVASVDNIFTTGSLQATGKNTDLAVDGDGFFMVKSGNNTYYTRAGNFDFDSLGNYVVPGTGLQVLGWNADANGNIDNNPNLLTTLKLNTSMPPNVSSIITFAKNLTGTANTVGAKQPTQKDIYDSLGTAHSADTNFVKVDDTTWLAVTKIADGTITAPQTAAYQELKFDSNGIFIGANQLADVPQGTTDMAMDLQLDNTLNSSHSQNFVVFDNSGNTRVFTLTTKCTDAAGEWSYSITEAGVTPATTVDSGTITWNTPVAGAYNSTGDFPGSFSFGNPPQQITIAATATAPAAGAFDATPTSFIDRNGVTTTGAFPYSTSGAAGPISFQPDGGANPLELKLDFSAVTQYADKTSSLIAESTDGYPNGTLDRASLNVDSRGVIFGKFSNGQLMNLGQVALALFTNPGGLTKVGSSLFSKSNNSGVAQIGIPGEGGFGSVMPSTLEMSNVDLSEEFTTMITTQRGFQANSRIITTSDSLLEELVNLKR